MVANSELSVLQEATGACPALGTPCAGSACGVRPPQSGCSEPWGWAGSGRAAVCLSGALQVLVLELNLSLLRGVCAKLIYCLHSPSD